MPNRRWHLSAVVMAVACLVPVAAVVAQGTPSGQAGGTQAEITKELAAGDAAFDREDWAGAVTAYKRALALGSTSVNVHFRLGYALHMTKAYEEALTHHVKAVAIRNPALRIDALYNAGCACALLGRTDEALEWLRKAVDAGFKDLTQVARDSDLESLRADARFRAMIDSIGKTPRLHEQMDAFVGSWTATTSDGKGTVQTTLTRAPGEAQAIVTSVQAPGGPWSGLMFTDHDSRSWYWVMADAIGTNRRLLGEPMVGGGMRFEGREYAAAGRTAYVRITLTPKTDAGFTERHEVSDDAKTWRVVHELTHAAREESVGK